MVLLALAIKRRPLVAAPRPNGDRDRCRRIEATSWRRFQASGAVLDSIAIARGKPGRPRGRPGVTMNSAGKAIQIFRKPGEPALSRQFCTTWRRKQRGRAGHDPLRATGQRPLMGLRMASAGLVIPTCGTDGAPAEPRAPQPGVQNQKGFVAARVVATGTSGGSRRRTSAGEDQRT